MLRKEILSAQRVLDSLDVDIKKKRDQIKKVNEDCLAARKVTEEHNVKILGMKSHSEEEKQTFEKKMLDLQDKLNVKDETVGELEKSTMKDTSVLKKGHTTTVEDHEEFSNPADLLKQRLGKWKANNRSKKQLLEKYMKNVQVIEDAFEQIREQTGISSIDEIVTTFIKAEEQNYSLYNYVNILNSDIDTIEEQNKNIAKEIKKHEELMNLSEAEKSNKAETLRQDIADVKEIMEKEDRKMTELEEKMDKIQGSVQRMVAKFQESKFRPAVTQPMNYNEETVFNNKNVTLFLAELEEYISELITHNEYKKNNPNAAIAAIPLDTLKAMKKDPNAKGPTIPGKEDIQIKDDIIDADEDKELVTDGRKLYENFNKMLRSGKLTINKKDLSNAHTHG